VVLINPEISQWPPCHAPQCFLHRWASCHNRLTMEARSESSVETMRFGEQKRRESCDRRRSDGGYRPQPYRLLDLTMISDDSQSIPV
jgi:hypothetical protein